MGLVGMKHIYKRQTKDKKYFYSKNKVKSKFFFALRSIGSSESKKVQFHKLVRSIANNFGRE